MNIILSHISTPSLHSKHCIAELQLRAGLICAPHMSPALNGSSKKQPFERSDMIEIRDGITLVFYPGLPHVYIECHIWSYIIYVCPIVPISSYASFYDYTVYSVESVGVCLE